MAAQAGNIDLRVRLAFSGGAALKQRARSSRPSATVFGITLRQSYGSTEAIFLAHNSASDPDATWASVGRPRRRRRGADRSNGRPSLAQMSGSSRSGPRP